MSIIGKTYIPNDNSYLVCLSSRDPSSHYGEENKVRLAGTVNSAPQKVTIISEPYEQEIATFNGMKKITFVNVKYDQNGHTYRVIYDPKGIKKTHQVTFGRLPYEYKAVLASSTIDNKSLLMITKLGYDKIPKTSWMVIHNTIMKIYSTIDSAITAYNEI